MKTHMRSRWITMINKRKNFNRLCREFYHSINLYDTLNNILKLIVLRELHFAKFYKRKFLKENLAEKKKLNKIYSL